MGSLLCADPVRAVSQSQCGCPSPQTQPLIVPSALHCQAHLEQQHEDTESDQPGQEAAKLRLDLQTAHTQPRTAAGDISTASTHN